MAEGTNLAAVTAAPGPDSQSPAGYLRILTPISSSAELAVEKKRLKELKHALFSGDSKHLVKARKEYLKNLKTEAHIGSTAEEVSSLNPHLG